MTPDLRWTLGAIDRLKDEWTESPGKVHENKILFPVTYQKYFWWWGVKYVISLISDILFLWFFRVGIDY